MNTGGRVAAAVAAGYLLGRRRKLKLAVAVGSMMAGKRIATNPRGLARQANELVQGNEQLSYLSDEVRDKLLTAARTAAISVASNRLDSFSDALHDRSESWRQAPGETNGGPEEVESEVEEEPEPEPEPAKKAPSKKAPAKKSTTTKKSAAKKSTGKKSAAKSTGKKTSKKTSSGTRS